MSMLCKDIWKDTDIVDAELWWCSLDNSEKLLQSLALKILAIPSSNAASEDYWSAMGSIHSKVTNKLTNNKDKTLTFLRKYKYNKSILCIN